jgi:hypothetical protein
MFDLFHISLISLSYLSYLSYLAFRHLQDQFLHSAASSVFYKQSFFLMLIVCVCVCVAGIKTYADNSLKINDGGEIVFNAGLRSKSIFISFQLYQGFAAVDVCWLFEVVDCAKNWRTQFGSMRLNQPPNKSGIFRRTFFDVRETVIYLFF